MRHHRRTKRLGCKTAHRKAMLGNMVTSLLRHGRIVTTVPRAKEVRRVADKMVTLAKRSSLHSRRQAFSVIRDRKVVAKLFDHWGRELTNRNGGYTRIVRIGPRRGDATMMSIVEMVTDSLEKPKSRRKVLKAESAESVIPQAALKPAVDEDKETSKQDMAEDRIEIQDEGTSAGKEILEDSPVTEEKNADEGPVIKVEAQDAESTEKAGAIDDQPSDADKPAEEDEAKEDSAEKDKA